MARLASSELRQRGRRSACRDCSHYRETTFTVRPHSTLVAFTDGLVERRGEMLDAGLDACERGRRWHRGRSGPARKARRRSSVRRSPRRHRNSGCPMALERRERLPARAPRSRSTRRVEPSGAPVVDPHRRAGHVQRLDAAGGDGLDHCSSARALSSTWAPALHGQRRHRRARGRGRASTACRCATPPPSCDALWRSPACPSCSRPNRDERPQFPRRARVGAPAARRFVRETLRDQPVARRHSCRADDL